MRKTSGNKGRIAGLFFLALFLVPAASLANTADITIDHGLKHHRTILTADGQNLNIVNIFIGGADENKTKVNVQNSEAFNKDVPGDNYYADYTQVAEVEAFIASLPKARLVNIMGFREGALSAVKIVTDYPGRVNKLYTLDPPNYRFPNVAEVRLNVVHWTDYTTNTKQATPAASAPDNKMNSGH